MPNINDFKGIPPITWGFVVMFLIGTIIPGELLIFLFREDLFTSVETLKLLFLSMGITFPVWVCNTLLILIILDDTKMERTDDETRQGLQAGGLLGAGISIFPLFIPALVHMFYPIGSSVAFYIGFGIEIIIIFNLIKGLRRK